MDCNDVSPPVEFSRSCDTLSLSDEDKYLIKYLKSDFPFLKMVKPLFSLQKSFIFSDHDKRCLLYDFDLESLFLINKNEAIATEKLQKALKGGGWSFLKSISEVGSVGGNFETNGITTIVINPNDFKISDDIKDYCVGEIEKMCFVRDKAIAEKNLMAWFENCQRSPFDCTTIEISVLNSGEVKCHEYTRAEDQMK
jgi:hypothetical protein